MTKTQLLELLEKKYGACDEAVSWVRRSKRRSVKSIWSACRRGDWMLWLASRAGVDRKLLVTAACACARQALRYVPAGEDRPRIAIETAERWVRGEATIEEVRAAADAAAAYAADAYAAAADAAAAAAYAYAAYADAAAAAAYAADAYADAAAAAAYAARGNRSRSLARSADLVREAIPYDAVMSAIGGAR